MKEIKKIKILIITLFLSVLLDQVIKILVSYNMNVADSIVIINNFFRITCAHNIGAAWSMLSGGRIILIILGILAINLIYIFFVNNKKLNKKDQILYGLLIGGINFKDLKCVLKDAYTDAAGNLQDAVTINYGNFIQVTLDLLLVAASIFLVIRLINKVKDKVIKKEEEPAAEPAPTKEEVLLTEIRDLLKQK